MEMVSESPTNFKDWFVLQVKAGREIYIKKMADKILSASVKMIIFTREIIHLKNGNVISLTLPLFSGYIFIYKEINFVARILRQRLYKEFIRPICFNSHPAKVSVKEMEWLLSNSDNNGKFKLSYGYQHGDSVKIIKGPLKDITGKIVFINKRKRKVKVRFHLFQSYVEAALGLDLLKK